MMRRRNFLQALTGALATLSLTPFRGSESLAQPETTPDNAGDIDPYFLESGSLTSEQQTDVEEYMEYVEKRDAGDDVMIPRGGRPERAPTYRIVHWDGELGDPDGRFVSPFSIRG